MSKTNGKKPWTGAELHRASRLWSDGATHSDIANTLGRGLESIKHQVERRRDLFPRRNQVRAHVSRDEYNGYVPFKFEISHFLKNAIKEEARRQNKSMNLVVREVLREYFIAKRQFEKPATTLITAGEQDIFKNHKATKRQREEQYG